MRKLLFAVLLLTAASCAKKEDDPVSVTFHNLTSDTVTIDCGSSFNIMPGIKHVKIIMPGQVNIIGHTFKVSKLHCGCIEPKYEQRVKPYNYIFY